MNEILKIIKNAIEDKKGENIKIINISEVTIISDYFIIASGNNVNQVQAIADNVTDEMLKLGIHPLRTEGYNAAEWVLIDFGDYVVHIFNKEKRMFYDLERIWRDGREVE